jgi:hypothetical protein
MADPVVVTITTQNPPYGASVSFEVEKAGTGSRAPAPREAPVFAVL